MKMGTSLMLFRFYFSLKSFIMLTSLVKVLKVKGQCAFPGDVIVGDGPCTYSIAAIPNFYTNNSFTTIVPPPLVVSSGDFIHMGVTLFNTSETTEDLLLEMCWATRTTDYVTQNVTNTIVDFPGCPSRRFSNVVELNNNGQSETVTIRFPIFFLLENQPEFYLHCSVGTCDNCPQSGCDSPARVPQTFTRTADVVTIGPVRRGDFVSTTNDSNPTSPGFIIAAGILSGVVVLVILILLIYLVLSSKKKKSKRQEKKRKDVPVLTNNVRLNTIENKSSAAPTTASVENYNKFEKCFFDDSL